MSRKQTLDSKATEVSHDLFTEKFEGDKFVDSTNIGELLNEYVVPTGKVKVPASRVKVLAGRYVVPTGNTLLFKRETKAETILPYRSLPEDHMADFHHLDDARDIWLVVKARVSESEGLHKGYDRFQKILSQLNQMQAKPDNEDCNMKFLRALHLLGPLKLMSEGVGSSYDSEVLLLLPISAFISVASTNSKMSYADSQNQSPLITLTTASSSADILANWKIRFGGIGYQMANGNALWKQLDSNARHEGEDEEKVLHKNNLCLSKQALTWMIDSEQCLRTQRHWALHPVFQVSSPQAPKDHMEHLAFCL
ncbi:hypothetical protein Tco_0088109 [Tanacetum coccineum]